MTTDCGSLKQLHLSWDQMLDRVQTEKVEGSLFLFLCASGHKVQCVLLLGTSSKYQISDDLDILWTVDTHKTCTQGTI